MVAGRSPPSRWSCRTTLGARRTWSSVARGPWLGSVSTALIPPSCQPIPIRGHRMRTFTSAEELEASVGQEVGVTDWVDIDQERVNLFADATDDHQWIHVDAEQSAAGP